MPALLSGTCLKQRYEIIESLAKGSFGETYTARDLENHGSDFLCVVKRLQPRQTDPRSIQEAKRLFFREADVLQRLPEYPYIPKFVDRFVETLDEVEDFYIVYEWIRGQPLSAEIKPNEPLDEERVLEILREILTILDFIHRNQVFHRDVKPDNIIVRDRDRRLVLIDFGSVKDISVNDRSQNSPTEVSTADYTPLEQQYGQSHPSHDLYALGMTAIEALTGRKPKSLRHPNGNVDWHNYANVKNEKFIAIIDKMVHPQFSQRYMSVGEVLPDIKPLKAEPHLKLPKIEIQQAWGEYWNQKKQYINWSEIQSKKKLLASVSIVSILLVASGLILPRLSWFNAFQYCQFFLDPERLDRVPARCQKDSQFKPKLAKAYTDRGDTLYDEEKFSESLADYEKANRYNPNNSIILTSIGDALYQLYRFEEGDIFYKQASQTEPGTALEWNRYGDALFTLDKTEQALASYRKATEEESHRPEFWIDLGNVLYKLDRDDEALEAYEKAIELNPEREDDRIRAWIGKGQALLGLKKLDEALEALEKAQAIDPNNTKSWFYKGLVLNELGEKRRAQNAYETVIDKCDRILNENPNDLEVLSQKADALGKLKKNQEALSLWEKIDRQYPDYFPAQLNLSNQLSFSGKYDAALGTIDRAIENVPEWKQPEVWVTKGSILIQRPSKDKLQDLEAAVEAFTKALEINPNFTPALQARGQASMELGQFQDALNDFDRAVRIDSQDAKSWILRGAVLAAMGRNEDALTSLEGGIRLDESDPVAWWQKGMVLEKLKREKDAEEAYDRAIELSPTFQQAIDARRKLQDKIDIEKSNPESTDKVPGQSLSAEEEIPSQTEIVQPQN